MVRLGSSLSEPKAASDDAMTFWRRLFVNYRYGRQHHPDRGRLYILRRAWWLTQLGIE